jgi:hypothetical protein
MTQKLEVIRLYKIDDANLITTTKGKIAFMRRDIIKLADYGITTAMLDDFEAQVVVFEEFPTDSELLGEQTYATELKDAKANELRDALEPIRTRVESKYGIGSARSKQFNIGNIARWDDANLLRCGRRVKRIGTIRLAELAPKGLTAAILDDLKTICNEFDELIIDQDEKTGERDIAQEDRVEMGNAIFLQLKELCRFGKSAWRTSDVAKYNDYLIYNTPSGTSAEGEPPIEDTYTGTVDPSATKTITTINEDATLVLSNTGTDKLVFFLSSTEDAIGEEVFVFGGETVTTTTADMSPDGDGTYLVVKNPNSTTIGSYSVEIQV